MIITPHKRKRSPQTTVFNNSSFLGTIAGEWRTLGPEGQMAWNALALLMPRWASDSAKPGRRPLDGYQCFTSVNVTRRAMSLPFLVDAPSVPSLPPVLAGIVVTASLPTAGGALTLMLNTIHGAPYPFPVQVYGGQPMLSSHALPRAADCKRVCFLADGIPTGGADISVAYGKYYRVPVAGYKVPLRVLPLSADGFRGPGIMAGGVAVYVSNDQ